MINKYGLREHIHFVKGEYQLIFKALQRYLSAPFPSIVLVTQVLLCAQWPCCRNCHFLPQQNYNAKQGS